MSAYINFEYDFIERTLMDIERYQGEFEVTALLNSCVGLLVIPKENLFDKLPDEDICQYGIDVNKVRVNDNSGCPHSLKNVLRHIRNSIAHGNFNQEDTSGGIIRTLRFQDFMKKNGREIETFEMKIGVEEFRRFAIRVANEVLATR